MTLTVNPSTVASTAGYGAREIKRAIVHNTLRAFLWIMSSLALVSLFGVTMPVIHDLLYPAPKIEHIHGTRVSIEAVSLMLPQQPQVPPTPKLRPAVSTESIARAGQPMPVPEGEFDRSAASFATPDAFASSSAFGSAQAYGQGTAELFEPGSSHPEQQQGTFPEDSVFADVEPAFDYGDLQRKVEYPEEARCNSIEGTVLVGALIDVDGSIVRIGVLEAESDLLSAAAIKAVSATVFTPARTDNRPVRAWVRILFRFSLP